MRIVLTGFGAFPGVEMNPSAHLVECLPLDLPPLAGHEVGVHVLPVTYRACAEWAGRALSPEPPDILLHIGVRASASGFELERMGRNVCRLDLADAEGAYWPAPAVVPEGPAMLPATLPADELQARLVPANLPLGLSDDAGGYVCNFIHYHSLWQVQQRRAHTWAGFLDIPQVAGLDPAHPKQCP